MRNAGSRKMALGIGVEAVDRVGERQPGVVYVCA